MEKQLNAQETINYSQIEDGLKLKPWRTERIYSALKVCGLCGNKFKPWIKIVDGKTKSAQPEHLWNKQNFCSIKCAKRSHPTVLTAQARQKISKRLKELKHKPINRGGNGQLLPLPQLALLHALGDGWAAEFSIKTHAGHRNGIYPNCYKVDIGNQELMIAIELDGGSHGTILSQERDLKKTEFLTKLGWSVFHVRNEKALHLFSTFKSVDILLTSLMM